MTGREIVDRWTQSYGTLEQLGEMIDAAIGGAPAYTPSGYSDREALKLFGGVGTERLEALIDVAVRWDAAHEAFSAVGDAVDQYPGEDFLSGMKTHVANIMKRCRGATKDSLRGVLESLDALENEVNGASEHGREILQEIGKALDGEVRL